MGGGYRKIVPSLGRDGTKIVPPGIYLTNLFIKAVRFGSSLPTMLLFLTFIDHVFLCPGGATRDISGTESPNPLPIR